MIENLNLKDEIEKNIIQQTDKLLSEFLQEQISGWELLQLVSNPELINEIKAITNEIGLGGSIVTGQPDKNSDIDIIFSVKSLNKLGEILKRHQINFEHEEVLPIDENKGRHNNIWFTLGKYKESPIELYFEEYPIYLQAMPVHINFALKTYKKYPEIKGFVEFLKHGYSDLENPFGYRKAPTFYAEIVFVNDLGYLPRKTETAPRGKKVPNYDGLNPWEWIYMKEVFGKERALEIMEQFK